MIDQIRIGEKFKSKIKNVLGLKNVQFYPIWGCGGPRHVNSKNEPSSLWLGSRSKISFSFDLTWIFIINTRTRKTWFWAINEQFLKANKTRSDTSNGSVDINQSVFVWERQRRVDWWLCLRKVFEIGHILAVSNEPMSLTESHFG